MFYYSCDILIFCTSTALIRHLHDIHSLQDLDLVIKFGSVFIKKESGSSFTFCAQQDSQQTSQEESKSSVV